MNISAKVEKNICPFCKKILSKTSLVKRTHHIKPKRYGGDNESDNLIDLHYFCHSKIHSFYIQTAFKIILEQKPDFFKICFDELCHKFPIENKKVC